jgi:uncharacterized small protein (DUF1192 family)
MLIAFRITPEQWLVEERFSKLLAFFDEQPKATDELAFFTSDTLSLLPLEEMEKRLERLAEIIPRVRERGYRAGINVLSIMGHIEENVEGSITEPWQRLVDPDGRPFAALVDYAAHASVMSWGKVFAADYPGFLQSVVEKVYDDKLTGLGCKECSIRHFHWAV